MSAWDDAAARRARRERRGLTLLVLVLIGDAMTIIGIGVVLGWVAALLYVLACSVVALSWAALESVRK